jgi:hypothetical protein
MRKSQGAPRSKQVEGEALDRNNPGMRPDPGDGLRAALGQCMENAARSERQLLLDGVRRGADVRPDFNWNKPPIKAMGYR